MKMIDIWEPFDKEIRNLHLQQGQDQGHNRDQGQGQSLPIQGEVTGTRSDHLQWARLIPMPLMDGVAGPPFLETRTATDLNPEGTALKWTLPMAGQD